MNEKRLIRIQALSGILFSLFLALHLANTLVAGAGHERYNELQSILRTLYQNPVFEIFFVMIPVFVHIAVGMIRWRQRRKTEQKPGWRMRTHRWAGWFLALVIVGHIAATRGWLLWQGVFTEFQGVSFALWWQPLIFYPYYVLLALTGLYHGVNGVLYALGVLKLRVSPRWRVGKRYWIPMGTLAVGLVLSVLAFGGLFFPIPDPTKTDYAKLYEKYLGVVLDR